MNWNGSAVLLGALAAGIAVLVFVFPGCKSLDRLPRCLVSQDGILLNLDFEKASMDLTTGASGLVHKQGGQWRHFEDEQVFGPGRAAMVFPQNVKGPDEFRVLGETWSKELKLGSVETLRVSLRYFSNTNETRIVDSQVGQPCETQVVISYRLDRSTWTHLITLCGKHPDDSTGWIDFSQDITVEKARVLELKFVSSINAGVTLYDGAVFLIDDLRLAVVESR